MAFALHAIRTEKQKEHNEAAMAHKKEEMASGTNENTTGRNDALQTKEENHKQHEK